MRPVRIVSLSSLILCACSPIELIDLGGDGGRSHDDASALTASGAGGSGGTSFVGPSGPTPHDAATDLDVPLNVTYGAFAPYPFADAAPLVCESYDAASPALEHGDGSLYSIALPAAASPASAQDGWIFFDSDLDDPSPGFSSIYEIRADGTGLTLLVSGGSEPAVSPDGTMLAFTSLAAGNTTQVFVRSIPGTDTKQVTSIAAGASQPAFSPDGKLIAFRSGADVWVTNADGSGARPVTVGGMNYEHPTFGPGGSTLVVDRGNEIDVFDLSGDFEGYLVGNSTTDELYPALSRDWTEVAFVLGGSNCTFIEHLAVVAFGATQNDLCAACPLSGDNLGILSHPSWGPRGLLAFAHASAGGLTRIVVTDTKNPAGWPVEILQDNGNQKDPFWAPSTFRGP